MPGDHDIPNDVLEDESSRLKEALRSCRSVVANYRAMLAEGSNDNSLDEAASDDSEAG